MPVIKSQLTKYRVFRNGECATIALGDWTNPKLEGRPVSYGGEILIHSSFGNFSHCWSACSVPFKEFLVGISMDSFMLKSMGPEYHKYNGKESVRKLKAAILRMRRQKLYSADDVRDLWNNVCAEEDDAEHSESGFYRLVSNLRDGQFDDAEAYLSYHPHQQAIGFWETLWPDFIAELKRELLPAEPELAADHVEEDI